MASAVASGSRRPPGVLTVTCTCHLFEVISSARIPRAVNTRMHAVVALSSVPLFLGALLSDWAYFGSHQIQWVNFAAWLIAGGLLKGGPALLWGAVDVLRSSAAITRAQAKGAGLRM